MRAHSERLVGETFRARLVGTYRGVTSRWLRAYVNETNAQSEHRARVVELLMQRVLSIGAPVTFRYVEARFNL